MFSTKIFYRNAKSSIPNLHFSSTGNTASQWSLSSSSLKKSKKVCGSTLTNFQEAIKRGTTMVIQGVVSCSLDRAQHFGGTYDLHFQGHVNQAKNLACCLLQLVSSFPYTFTLKRGPRVSEEYITYIFGVKV
jgi:hypothetical protein